MAAPDLKDVCRGILLRHNRSSIDVFQCVVCDNQMKGSDALMMHLHEFHGVKIEHFDDVADLNGMLAFLRSTIHGDVSSLGDSDVEPLVCPVCRVCCKGGAPDLKDHMELEEHQEWKRATIAELGQYSALSTVADDESDEDVHPNAVADDASVDDTDDDYEGDEESALCLYCSAVLPLNGALEAHLQSAHQLNLPEYVKSHSTVVTSEYDLIRMTNFVRECVGKRTCPVASCSFAATSEAEWATHISSSRHFFPETVPAEDRYLIPRIPGDMLISYLLECTWLTDEDDESERYPMVETLGQQTQKQRERSHHQEK